VKEISVGTVWFCTGRRHLDTVLFGKYSGTEVKVEGEELLVMREEDIMAVVEA